MRCRFGVLLLLCVVTTAVRAQENRAPSVSIGDPAPALRLRGWVKGEAVEQFEKGKVYVLEFWATWCRPCIAAMPHLSAVAREYEERVTVLSIDVYENKLVSLGKIKAFADSMGNRMDFQVAAEDSNFMVAGWLDDTGEKRHGIPRTFIVDGEGRLVWMGYPTGLDSVLAKVVSRTWDIKGALAKRKEDRRLAELDDSLGFEFAGYLGGAYKAGDRRKADSLLLWIDKIIKKEPKLQYAPFVGVNTFSALLLTDPHKAYEFGKVAMVTPTYEEPNYHLFYGSIGIYSDSLHLPAEIYELGAEAYQLDLDHRPYKDNDVFARLYHEQAALYWRANDGPKAIEAAQKAIDMLKSGGGFSKSRLVAYESQLQEYKGK
ncbi:MAG TPA: TlpA disulfide reductase family protein [Puia sp.]|jgi:thiol-disulfide isomerase/thioredoxin